MRRATRRRKKRVPENNTVVVGVNYLLWRFTPGSLPGLNNIFPVLCDLRYSKDVVSA